MLGNCAGIGGRYGNTGEFATAALIGSDDGWPFVWSLGGSGNVIIDDCPRCGRPIGYGGGGALGLLAGTAEFNVDKIDRTDCIDCCSRVIISAGCGFVESDPNNGAGAPISPPSILIGFTLIRQRYHPRTPEAPAVVATNKNSQQINLST